MPAKEVPQRSGLDAIRAIADEEDRLAALTNYIEVGEQRLAEARMERVAVVRLMRARQPPKPWPAIVYLARVGEAYLRREIR